MRVFRKIDSWIVWWANNMSAQIWYLVRIEHRLQNPKEMITTPLVIDYVDYRDDIVFRADSVKVFTIVLTIATSSLFSLNPVAVYTLLLILVFSFSE